ncbi:hypothetical protein [Sphingomonas sp. CLY1604]|uniref:hypothetical protein n=1 Tax=Sphingomonas sp. CLY1604 TaxID=3457786 RepID=UPI003FD73383
MIALATMFAQLLTPPYLPFAIAFVVMVGIGIIEALPAVAAAMRYRVGGPLIDGLMAELGMSGGSLNGMLAGSGGAVAAEPAIRVEHTAAD